MHLFHLYARSKIKTKHNGTIYLADTQRGVAEILEQNQSVVTLRKSNLTQDKPFEISKNDIISCVAL